MPEIDVENRKATGVWKFETTPRMSSYLLAFAAGDMQGITAKTKNGTLVGVYATKAHPESNLEFALDIAVRCIEFLRRILWSQVSDSSVPSCGPARFFCWGYGKLGLGNLSGNLSAGG